MATDARLAPSSSSSSPSSSSSYSSSALIAGLPVASLGDLIARDGGVTSYSLAVLYACASFYSLRRFLLLRRRRRAWDAPRLFVASVCFACLLRTASFGALAGLAFAKVTVAPSSGAGAEAHVLQVIMNLGDFQSVATYLLLIVCWVEMQQQARGSFFDEHKLRRDWLIAYVVLNALLCLLQLGLYAAVLAGPVALAASLLRDVYTVIAALNFLLPMLLLSAYAAAQTCLFSGFPFRSAEARANWADFNRLALWWTLSRLLWAVASVFAANDLFVAAVDAIGSWLFTVAISSVFIFAELLPFLTSLGSSVLRLFGGDADERQARPADELDADGGGGGGGSNLGSGGGGGGGGGGGSSGSSGGALVSLLLPRGEGGAEDDEYAAAEASQFLNSARAASVNGGASQPMRGKR